MAAVTSQFEIEFRQTRITPTRVPLGMVCANEAIAQRGLFFVPMECHMHQHVRLRGGRHRFAIRTTNGAGPFTLLP
eukprot:82431-Amphidinium_carterae.2